jgi:DNA invertase Pin-like site-specific DNA recombinase
MEPRTKKHPRVFGIIRISEQGDREDERLHSPENQLAAIQAECNARGYELVDYDPEVDVSGGLPLIRRPALHKAVLAVESGEIDIVMAPALDRLVRNRRVQDEVRDRIQAARGRLISLDIGEVTNGTPERDFAVGLLGDVNELYRKQISAKTKLGHARAIELGRNIGPTPPGYVIGEDGRLEPDPPNSIVIRNAFEQRASGQTFEAIAAYLAEHEIHRTPPGVRKMLKNRVYLGEVSHGMARNRKAHVAIVDRPLFDQVQRMELPGGRLAKSDRLLARQGILRCGTCGSKMSVGHDARGWYFYHCTGYGCQRKMAIGADIAESVIENAVKQARSDLEARASADEHYRRAVDDRDHWESERERRIRVAMATDTGDEPVAIEAIQEATERRDAAQTEVDRLAPARASLILDVHLIWEHATLAERRGLITATIKSAIVHPGRGPGRITVQLLGE